MAQHDYSLANAAGVIFRTDLNNALSAIVTNNSGATEPSPTFPYQWWADTSTGMLKQRNAANNAWITIGTLASTNLGLASLAANTFTGIQRWARGADVASAATLTLGTDGNYFNVTGTTAITGINTVGVGTWVKLVFTTALTLTHHATNLILPGGANITTAAGDVAEFVEYAVGSWRCTSYIRAALGPANLATETQAGLVELATTAEALAGTADTVVMTPFKNTQSFKGANQSLTANGYQRLPGGLIIQWGSFILNITAYAWISTSVTFPIAFPNRTFIVNSSVASLSAGTTHPAVTTGIDNLAIDSISTTGFKQWAWDTYQAGPNEFKWIAIGY